MRLVVTNANIILQAAARNNIALEQTTLFTASITPSIFTLYDYNVNDIHPI